MGKMVRTRRLEATLSQDELGKLCEVHRSYITEIENGMRNISVLTVNKLARALQLEAWQLLFFQHITTAPGDSMTVDEP